MTNRQSNIIFYSVISLVLYAVVLNFTHPEFFENFTKSKEERSIKEAKNKGEHNKALSLYQKIVEERINDNEENTIETATLYEDMANLYLKLGKKDEEKNYYLKSLNIKEQLKEVDLYSFGNTYYKLGSIAEREKQYDQAIMYFEKSLKKRLGETEEDEDLGLITGMHKNRLDYIRLNNEETITTFKKLGEIHHIKNDTFLAKTYYERALAASKTTFGEDDVKTIEIIDLMRKLGL